MSVNKIYLQSSSDILNSSELRYDFFIAEPTQLEEEALNRLCRRQANELCKKSLSSSPAMEALLRTYRDYAIMTRK